MIALQAFLSAMTGGAIVMLIAWAVNAASKNEHQKEIDLPEKPIPMEHDHGK